MRLNYRTRTFAKFLTFIHEEEIPYSKNTCLKEITLAFLPLIKHPSVVWPHYGTLSETLEAPSLLGTGDCKVSKQWHGAI